MKYFFRYGIIFKTLEFYDKMAKFGNLAKKDLVNEILNIIFIMERKAFMKKTFKIL